MKLRHRITAIARREIGRFAAIATARAVAAEKPRTSPSFRPLATSEIAVYLEAETIVGAVLLARLRMLVIS